MSDAHFSEADYIPLKKVQRNFRDLAGRRFGRLVVERLLGRRPENDHLWWFCACDCGWKGPKMAGTLLRGHTRSCGCLRRDLSSTHGQTGTKEYKTWQHIRRRCFNPKALGFERYGAVGITVCERYRRFFEAFFADVGRAPSAKHSIDRRDVYGHYSCGKCPECVANGWPMNVRWLTPKEQMANLRYNRVIEYDGRSLTVTRWSEITGIHREVIWHRIKKKWPVREALTTPVGQSHSLVAKSKKVRPT